MIPSIPQVSFEEIPIVIETMVTGILVLFFILVLFCNLLGLISSDKLIDKKKKENAKEGDKPYDLEWSEVLPLSLIGAVFSMVLILYVQLELWSALSISILMGASIRIIFPKFVELFQSKVIRIGEEKTK